MIFFAPVIVGYMEKILNIMNQNVVIANKFCQSLGRY